jgi:hypothetical protein
MIFGKIFLGCPAEVLGYPLGYHDRKLLMIGAGGGGSLVRTALPHNRVIYREISEILSPEIAQSRFLCGRERHTERFRAPIGTGNYREFRLA